MNGYRDRVLEVDLSSGLFHVMSLPQEMYRDYLGGAGIAARLLWDRFGPALAGLDPLAPENPLIFMTGPLTETGLPSCNRSTCSSLSPLTGIWGESNLGGYFGPELKFAGYDGVIVMGAAAHPVWLVIDDDRVELLDAAGLWGLDTYEIYERLSPADGPAAEGTAGGTVSDGPGAGAPSRTRFQVLAIGPAGENGVRFAGITHNRHHVFGRAGMGCVMGSKKLKAIAVRGSRRSPFPLADPERFQAVRKGLVAKQGENIAIEGLRAFGTQSGFDVGLVTGDVPMKNWAIGEWEGADRVNSATYADTILVRGRTCYACPVVCKREVEVKEDPYRMGPGPGPEYETVANFGPMILNNSLPAIARASELCNRYGMDTITLGSTIAFAIDCWEQGRIGPAETGGTELRWGDADLLLELIHKTARGEGFGRDLGLGSAALARRWGAEDLCTAVKGLEAPAHDPRGAHGLGLAYATGARGADHVNCMTYAYEGGTALFPALGYVDPPEGQSSEGKAEKVFQFQNLGQVFYGAAAVCHLGGFAFTEEDLLEMLAAVTGVERSLQDLLRLGERVWLLKRVISNLRGVTAQDDFLPKKLRTPLSEGGAAGSIPDMDRMLAEYYPLRGLDAQGRPTRDCLGRVGLAEPAILEALGLN
ncbi:MAG: aldehyde ferredoxin oxidoreductase family protein [Bacillota bacterium]